MRSRLKQILQQSWSKETCYPGSREQWSPELPEIGQCAVTALLVQDQFGGYIVFNRRYNHFWNILSDGKALDYTRHQFQKRIRLSKDEVVDPHTILHSKEAKKQHTLKRFQLLKARIDQASTAINSAY